MPRNSIDKSDENNISDNNDFEVAFASKKNIDGEETIVLTSEEITKEWLSRALQSFDPSNRQYSVQLNDEQGGFDKISLNEISELAKNAQNNISKILSINSIIRQKINEDDIIGNVYEAVISNLNADIRLSFDNLPPNYKKKAKEKAEGGNK